MGSILTKLFTKKSTLKSLFGNRKKVVGSTFLAVIFICGGSKTTSEKIQHNFASLTSETSILMLRGGGLKLVFRMKDHLRLIAEAVKLDSSIQKEIEILISNLTSNPLTTKTEQVASLKNVFVARGKNESVVFFRQVEETLEILAKSNTASESRVVGLLKEFNY